MHDEPIRGRARLPDVAELGRDGAIDGLVEIGIVEHDERRVAAQLHRRAQHTGCGLLEQPLPDRRRTGEGQLPEPRVTDDRLGHRRRCRRGEHVDYPCRHAGILEELREIQSRQRSELGRIDHHRAPRRERRGDLAGRHGQRKVPRRHQEAWTDRMLRDDHPPGPLRVGTIPTLHPHGLFAEPPNKSKYGFPIWTK